MIADPRVALCMNPGAEYPAPPFDPAEAYPEFAAWGVYDMQMQARNDVYGLVRNMLALLGLDRDRYGTPLWDPLGDLVQRGDAVVIKPNLVFHRHPAGAPGVEAMVTHASVVRPLLDYVLKASGGQCRISICDVPLQSAVWEDVTAASGMRALVDFYAQRGICVELLDLRHEIAELNRWELIVRRRRNLGDSRGSQVVDLRARSYLSEIHQHRERLEITDYGHGTVARHHDRDRNEYLIPRTILEADVFINIPKMKTHRKAGVSLAMKNLVGINSDKSWIAHHRRGIDEYPEFRASAYLKWYASYYLKTYAPLWLTRLVYWSYQRLVLGRPMSQASFGKPAEVMEGNWHGNDTVWRTVLDLNNLLLFADKTGQLRDTPQRRYLAVIDGIVGMEREGPMNGTPRRTGLVLGGFHPVAVDFAAATAMGMAWDRIPCIREGFAERFFGLTPFQPADVPVAREGADADINLHYEPSSGWRCAMER